MRWAMTMFLILLWPQAAAASVLHVPADYPTIGSATAVAVPGDEVLVAPGTYHERFTLSPGQDGVKIHSESGPAVTIIDGGFTGSVVSMTLVGAGTELFGFTIQHGGHVSVTSSDLGGAIRLDRASPTIENDVIKLNNSFRGAIYVTDGSPSITSCAVDSNTSSEGGGFYVVSGAPAISGSTVANNRADRGAGVYLAGGTSTISGTTISNNVAHDNADDAIGGGIYAVAGTVSGNTIANNQAYSGGGVSASGTTVVQDNIIRDNAASSGGFGGGIYLLSGSPTSAGNTITNNQAYAGGGIAVGPGANSPSIRNNVLRDNKALSTGGGICFVNPSGGTIDGNQILTNSASSAGGIELSSPHSAVVTNNLIQGNMASSGSSGGLEIVNCNPLVEKNLILGNHCVSWGGGVAIWALSSPTLIGNTITLNQGDLGGGNVYVRFSSPTLQNNILSHTNQQGLFLDPVQGPVSATLSCNDISHSAGGNYHGIGDQTGLNGNISSDPLFCDLMALDVHLSSASPCTAANAPAGCGLMGALDVNCEGPVRTEVTTWGRMKARYR